MASLRGPATIAALVLLVITVLVPATPSGAEAQLSANVNSAGSALPNDQTDPEQSVVPPIEQVRPSIRWWVRILDAASADLRRVVAHHQRLNRDITALQVSLAELQQGGLTQAQQRVDRLQSGIVDAERLRDVASARADELERQRKQVAVGLYLTGPVQQLDYAGALGHSSSLDRTRAMVAVNSGVGVAAERLEQQRAEVERYQRAADRRRQALDAEVAGMSDIQMESDRIVTRMFTLQAAAEQAEWDMLARAVQASQAQELIVFLLLSAGSPAHSAIDPTLSIVGPSTLTAD